MRALWLIDGSYIYKAMKSFQRLNPPFGGKGVDYKRMKDAIMARYGIDEMDCYYFNSTLDPVGDSQNPFHQWLKTAEPQGPNIKVKLYGVKTKSYICQGCAHPGSVKVQKGVDVGIATTALRLSDRYDMLVLSAGDSDFEDFIRYLVEDRDMRMVIVGFNGSVAPDIQQYATEIFFLNENYADICNSRDVKPFERMEEVALDD